MASLKLDRKASASPVQRPAPRPAWIVLDENNFPAFYDEDAGTAGVCQTEHEAQVDIVDHFLIQLEQFKSGERKFEEIDLAQFSYVACAVRENGDIGTEDGEYTREEIRRHFGVGDETFPTP